MAVSASINRQETKPVAGLVPLAWVLAPGLFAAAILGAFVLYAALTPFSTKPATTATPSIGGGLAWGGTILWNKPQVKSWLRVHGAAYPTWKRRHPAALKIITPKQRHRAHAQVKRKHGRGAKPHH